MWTRCLDFPLRDCPHILSVPHAATGSHVGAHSGKDASDQDGLRIEATVEPVLYLSQTAARILDAIGTGQRLWPARSVHRQSEREAMIDRGHDPSVILAWRVAITLTTDLCLQAAERALAKHGRPGIFNTDQGRQYTSNDFTDLPKAYGIANSVDGKGAWRDNGLVERFGRTVKYAAIWRHASDRV